MRGVAERAVRIRPYIYGRPRIWVVFILSLWVCGLFLCVGWAVFTAAYWFDVIDRALRDRLVWLVALIGLGVELAVFVGYYRRVRVKRCLAEHGRVLRPRCAYPVFVCDDAEAERVCPECGSALVYEEGVRSWARVPSIGGSSRGWSMTWGVEVVFESVASGGRFLTGAACRAHALFIDSSTSAMALTKAWRALRA